MRYLLCLAFFVPIPSRAASWQFKGGLSSVQSSAPECDTVFKETSYHTRVFAVGANHLTAVVYFENEALQGTLHQQSLTGLHGGNGDIQVEKTTPLGVNRLQLVASGLFDPDVLVLHIVATLRAPAGGAALCHATADYSGFAD